jgi:hypothetical protein
MPSKDKKKKKKKKDPLEEALEILKKYVEGTPPREHEYCD